MLRTPAFRISVRSSLLLGFCVETPTKPRGSFAWAPADAGAATATATTTAAMNVESLRVIASSCGEPGRHPK